MQKPTVGRVGERSGDCPRTATTTRIQPRRESPHEREEDRDGAKQACARVDELGVARRGCEPGWPRQKGVVYARFMRGEDRDRRRLGSPSLQRTDPADLRAARDPPPG